MYDLYYLKSNKLYLQSIYFMLSDRLSSPRGDSPQGKINSSFIDSWEKSHVEKRGKFNFWKTPTNPCNPFYERKKNQ